MARQQDAASSPHSSADARLLCSASMASQALWSSRSYSTRSCAPCLLLLLPLTPPNLTDVELAAGLALLLVSMQGLSKLSLATQLSLTQLQVPHQVCGAVHAGKHMRCGVHPLPHGPHEAGMLMVGCSLQGCRHKLRPGCTQLQNMMEKGRIFATLIFLVAIALTLFAAIKVRRLCHHRPAPLHSLTQACCAAAQLDLDSRIRGSAVWRACLVSYTASSRCCAAFGV